MKKYIFLISFFFVISTICHNSNASNSSPASDAWKDPDVFGINRLPMSATFVTEQQKTISLNGIWKFNFNKDMSTRPKSFYNLKYNDSNWTTIPVPGMWEMYGFCDPIYVNVGYPWKGHFNNQPPIVPTEHNYVGQYRKEFTLDKSLLKKNIYLCIGSATSNVRVWINGKEVGYSEDSKLEARFDISKYVKPGKNLIALEIFRWCDGSYVEDQDFWRLGGIARGVYVYTREKEGLKNININADMYGNLEVKGFTSKGIKSLVCSVFDNKNNEVLNFKTSSYTKSDNEYVYTLNAKLDNPLLWSAELPNLYKLKVYALDKKKNIVESTSLDFGFRTVEIKNNQLLVNGKAILIKGVNRHELTHYGGYVISPADMIKDIKIMKSLNINAVRTCHYPNDPVWLSLCDKYGLYVVDEANIESHGMGYGQHTLAKNPLYKSTHLIRTQRMVRRDINHPSIIYWSLGNEAGNGPNFYNDYDWIKSYDKTRPIMYSEAHLERNTDIYCPMYRSLEECVRYLHNNPTKPLIQCEYAHAMGNSLGGFKEYWDLIRKEPLYQGGYIWDFQDQALRWNSDFNKTGTDHIYVFGGDFNDYDISDGSFNCNGVIAADRTLHPHAYEVRYQLRSILSNIKHCSSLDSLDNICKINIYNEYFFKSLKDYRLKWTVLSAGKEVLSGFIEDLNIAPGDSSTVSLGVTMKDILSAANKLKESNSNFVNLGRNKSADNDIYLNLSYTLKCQDGLLDANTEVSYDQIPLRVGKDMSFPVGTVSDSNILYSANSGDSLIFNGNFIYAGTSSDRVSSWEAIFNNGILVSYKIDEKEYMKEPLTINFDRAPTENDMGAGLHKHLEVWRHPNLIVKNVSKHISKDNAQIDVEFAPIKDYAVLKLRYTIYPDGSISVCEKMDDAGNLSKAPDLFRFGMKFTLEGECSNLNFYGYGPYENYVDRNSSCLMGEYNQRVEEQYNYGYVRTQESGTKTGLRWFKITNERGTGIELSASTRFSASALPFSIEDIDVTTINPLPRKNRYSTQQGVNRHSLEVKSKAKEGNRSNGSTYVNFELCQQGLGCINSWGRRPLPQYRINAKEMEFNFVIRPVNN